MTSSKKHSASSPDFFEYMASLKNPNKVVVNLESTTSDSSSDEVEIVNELDVTLTNHRCDLCCEGEFLVDKLLRFGGLIDEKYKFVCDKCDKNFVYKSELGKHVSQCKGPVYKSINDVAIIGEQTSKNLKKCTACSKTFKTQGGLTKHMNSQHSGLTHTCQLCKKSFSSFQKFREHCFEHQRARPHYSCQVCDKRFRWENTLKKHLQKTHQL